MPKEIRLGVDEATHAAVKVLAESVGMGIDRWVGSLIRSEVSRQLATARQLAAAVSEKDLLRVESSRVSKIYFIQRGSAGPIKIGKAIHVERRLAALQVSCAEELMLLAALDETPDVSEKVVHRRFRHLRRGGEWFAADHELLDFIASIQGSGTVSKADLFGGKQK